MGKLLGALFGLAWLGWPGALFGLYLGHLFDKSLRGTAGFTSQARQHDIQVAFFKATFFVMGRLAKADGRVSRDEIQWAESVMARMSLTQEHRRQAMDYFNQGKQDNADISDVVSAFRQVAGRNAMLIQMFLEIQIQAAYADGELSASETKILEQLCSILGVSALQFRMIHQRVRAERAFAGADGGAGYSGGYTGSTNLLKDAYDVLGVSESASDQEVKRAYRKLMSQHHPDKLVSKGLPEEMMRLAKEKTQEIQAAYETVKKSRDT